MAITDIRPDLIAAIEKTGVRRFYELLDPEHPAYDPRYESVVLAAAGMAQGEKPPDRPGLLRQARTFGTAAVRHVAAGMPTVSDDVKAARLAICQACDQFDDGRCRACGCWLRTKASWALENCPLGRWPKVED